MFLLEGFVLGFCLYRDFEQPITTFTNISRNKLRYSYDYLQQLITSS
jgi:hypothetical protein